MNAFTNHDSGRYSAAQGEGGRAAAPAPSRRPNAAQRPRSGPHGGGVTWDRIKASPSSCGRNARPRRGWAGRWPRSSP